MRGTVRSLKVARKVGHLADLCPGSRHKLELVEADLLQPGTWDGAVAGADFVLHVASPFPIEDPKDLENDLFRPAVEGTLNVLRACAAASPPPRRVVVTSSVSAVAYGRAPEAGRAFTEADWTVMEDPASPHYPLAYIRSKTMAERAAWAFVASLPTPAPFTLATVCPTMVQGPLLGAAPCSSADILKKLLMAELPGLPNIYMQMVDVRDVARLHLAAMTHPDAPGRRFLAHGVSIHFRDVAAAVDAEFRGKGYAVPLRMLPDWLLRLAGLWDLTARSASKLLGADTRVVPENSAIILGFTFSADGPAMLREMAYSAIEAGLIPDKSRGKTLSVNKPGKLLFTTDVRRWALPGVVPPGSAA